MSKFQSTCVALGLLTGLAVPPLLTKFVLFPVFVQSKYDEINTIKQELEFVGWNVRHLEEDRGLEENELYVPRSHYKASY
ncbi:uncharacterized protein RJT21DRAFT_121587 [Scheffersomyces amazonensis]|uniref:uncharacterized protein n=1 Tax=Scheffersomyces amazonensis TaxID=1078765 RepID=UPI00315D5CBD